MDGMFSWPKAGQNDVQVFGPNSPTSTGTEDGCAIWRKKPGASMVAIFALGGGGGGGNGTVGAVSNAGGGGGGGAGGQVYVEMPAFLVPDTLFINVGFGGTAGNSGGRSIVQLAPGNYPAQNALLVECKGGSSGGSGAGGGSGGSGGAVGAIGNMPMACGTFVSYAGHGANSAPGPGSPSNTNLPLTGVRACAGCPGAGLNGSGVAGSVGGTYANPDSRVFPSVSGGSAGSTTTTPGGQGTNGFQVLQGQFGYWYGGTGGGSSHGSATGAGLVGGNGGDGGIGSGGGGGGGALTGSTQGIGGRGGDGIVIICQW